MCVFRLHLNELLVLSSVIIGGRVFQIDGANLEKARSNTRSLTLCHSLTIDTDQYFRYSGMMTRKRDTKREHDIIVCVSKAWNASVPHRVTIVGRRIQFSICNVS